MPRPPHLSPASGRLAGGVYSAYADRLDPSRELYPLHVGDTYLEPPPGSRCWELTPHPELHRYTATDGLRSLREVIAAHTAAKTAQTVELESIYVTAGATAGLAVTIQALVAPDDEVLILAPYWPLIAGMIRVCGGVVQAVDTLDLASAAELEQRLESAVSSRTVAIYYSSPNNPSGQVFSDSWVTTLTQFATRHDLWLLADDVYDLYCFETEHVSALGRAPERTIVANSASKAFAMAGNRCGWLIAPPPVLDAVHRLGTHAFYSAPTASQGALSAALEGAEQWVEQTRSAYRDIAQEVAETLGQPVPGGGTFLFIDLADALDASGLPGFLETCADHNLLLAPGPSFGPYPTSARICYTAAEPRVVRRATQLLAELLERSRRQNRPAIHRFAPATRVGRVES